MRAVLALLVVWCCVLAASASDRPEAPHFVVTSVGGGEKEGAFTLEHFPLLSTNASVSIAGVIADVVVTQRYKNNGNVPIEALYVFPGSTRAAVYDMKMQVGERVLQATAKRKHEARQEYERAREEGDRASLLEQHRPNVFQMNVANILPGDEILVRLAYTELLNAENGVYEFVYPTVVGPRYSSDPSVGAPFGARYTSEGQPPTYAFGIEVALKSGIPIKSLATPTHLTDVLALDPRQQHMLVKLSEDESNGGNRDFILRYQLAGDDIESGILVYNGDDDNEKYFMAVVQPPKSVSVANFPAREYIFIVDVSGSMSGFPLDVAKQVVEGLLRSLRPIDKFNILFFSGGSNLLSEASLPCTEENIQQGMAALRDQHGWGGTELIDALKRALALPKSQGYARSMVVVTDGYVDADTEAIQLIRGSLSDSNMFAFGIGSSVNRYLIEGLAKAGFGEPLVVTDEDEVHDNVEKFKLYISSPILTQVHVSFSDFDAWDIEPASIPDILAERPIVISGRFRGSIADSAAIEISGYTGSNDERPTREWKWSQRLSEAQSVSANSSALRYLWARKRLDALELLRDFASYGAHNHDAEEQICQIGLEHQLLTSCTSFVVVDRRGRDGDDTAADAAPQRPYTVSVPLPLPKGVSNNALGRGNLHAESAGYFYGNRKSVTISGSRAATGADQIFGASSPGEILLLDVTPLSLGVEQPKDGKFVPILPRNSIIPTKRSIEVALAVDEANLPAEGIDLLVYEGEREVAKDNHLLTRITVDQAKLRAIVAGMSEEQLQEARKPEPGKLTLRLEVSIELDCNSVIIVAAASKDVPSVRVPDITVDGSHGRFSEEEIEALIRAAEAEANDR